MIHSAGTAAAKGGIAVPFFSFSACLFVYSAATAAAKGGIAVRVFSFFRSSFSRLTPFFRSADVSSGLKLAYVFQANLARSVHAFLSAYALFLPRSDDGAPDTCSRRDIGPG
jgi:hypothetical protein